MESGYEQIHIRRAGAVATLLMQWPDGSAEGVVQFHHEFPLALHELRYDDSVRVVVLRGAGPRFLTSVAPERSEYLSPKTSIIGSWPNTFAAIRENAAMLDGIVDMEKPVIAMVNGDALGIGASVALHCDLIVANEDALISDLHLAVDKYLTSYSSPVGAGVVPGDGGCVIWPLQMGLAKAKEFVLTGRPVKARELAQMGAINAAVPLDRLQATVDGYVGDLLKRPAWALGWAKMALNKRLKHNLDLTLDLSIALEALSARIRDVEPGQGTERL
jgi:enoyl-CoA hydratase